MAEPVHASKTAGDANFAALCDAVVFVGQSLGPLFLLDPKLDAVALMPAITAFATLDAKAAEDWPLAPSNALGALCLISDGAQQALNEAPAGGIEELAWEYRRLFVGPGPKAAPPWGSVYTDRECVVFGESTLKLRAWMRTNGIARLGDRSQPEDHMGLMLLLAAWIAQNRSGLLPEYLQQHLLPWSSHYLQLMAAEAHHPFYRGLAQLTQISLEAAGRELDLSITYPRFYR